MFRPRHTALYLAIGTVALAAGDAGAGCKSIGGTTVCASYIQGSEICEVISVGLVEPLNAFTCTITGVTTNVVTVFPEEGKPYDATFYCASGTLPRGELTCAAPSMFQNLSLVSPGAFPGAGTKAGAKLAKADKKCGPTHKARHPGKNENCVPDVTLPAGSEFVLNPNDAFVAEGSDPVCDQLVEDPLNPGGPLIAGCSSTAVVLPPAGTTCENGQPAIDFTAKEMLAIVEACVDTGAGIVCGTIYDHCTLKSNGDYQCDDVTDQFPDPLDPYCATGGGGGYL